MRVVGVVEVMVVVVVLLMVVVVVLMVVVVVVTTRRRAARSRRRVRMRRVALVLERSRVVRVLLELRILLRRN